MALYGSIKIINEITKQKIMDGLFWLLVFVFSLVLISSIGRVKASKKQLNRNNRINWLRRSRKTKTIEENIIEGESYEVSENNEK